MGLQKNIAYRLRTLREASKLSQQEVAERADLSLSLIAKMEQGRKADPRASTLLALAGALGVKPGQLIEDLAPPPEGYFAAKGKKGKKKKKDKMLAALVGAVGGDAAEPATADLAVAPNGLDHAGENGKHPKKRKRKEKPQE
jgi:transcriptional regulator with XRE-family HTH domain